MNSSEKRKHKNQLRRQQRDEIRQALLISDYIKLKHSEAYKEAANFYNYLNGIYPTKKDLRRTDDFKALKMGFIFEEKNGTRRYTKQVFRPIPTVNPNNFTLICYPEVDVDQVETAHPEVDVNQVETAHPEVDVNQVETAQSEGEHSQKDHAASPKDHADQDSQHPQKIMQLRIPLLKPSVTTQTVKVVTQEILEESPLQAAYNEVLSESTQIHPTLNEEIPEEIFQKIIAELHQDPELHNIMDEIEQQIELEQLDMCIDIPDDIRLEQELDGEFW